MLDADATLYPPPIDIFMGSFCWKGTLHASTHVPRSVSDFFKQGFVIGPQLVSFRCCPTKVSHVEHRSVHLHAANSDPFRL